MLVGRGMYPREAAKDPLTSNWTPLSLVVVLMDWSNDIFLLENLISPFLMAPFAPMFLT
jgi:hypothetical protein